VGLFAAEQYCDSLYLATLAVAKEVRRQDIAMCILDYVSKLAETSSVASIELSVLKVNTPAEKLYAKYGFEKQKESELSLVLQKRIGYAKS
jgi:ribosomal protein S18 acetylase RimI-like enzyme